MRQHAVMKRRIVRDCFTVRRVVRGSIFRLNGAFRPRTPVMLSSSKSFFFRRKMVSKSCRRNPNLSSPKCTISAHDHEDHQPPQIVRLPTLTPAISCRSIEAINSRLENPLSLIFYQHCLNFHKKLKLLSY